MKTVRLYPYQKEGVRRIQEFGGRCLLADQQGLGKTVQSLYWAWKYLPEEPSGPIVVVCPSSAKGHWEREAMKHLGLRVEVLYGQTVPDYRINPSNPNQIYVINYDILTQPRRDGKKQERERNWANFLNSQKPRLIIGDECFPGRVLVSTDKGNLPIGFLAENQIPVKVRSFDQKTGRQVWRRVVQYSKKYNSEQIRVTHEFGSLDCTPTHRIWTVNRGYVPAKDLTTHDYLQMVPSGIPMQVPVSQGEETPLLRNVMFGEVEAYATPRQTSTNRTRQAFSGGESRSEKTRRSGTHAAEQPVQASRGASQNAGYEGEERHVARLVGGARRQWEKNPSRANAGGCIERFMDPTTGHQNGAVEWFGLSSALQSRFGAPGAYGGCGSGREGAHKIECGCDGQEENDHAGISRVVCVAFYKSGNRNQSGRSGQEDSAVYCLTAEEDHNFFADGVLVHNCHYAKANTAARTKAFRRLCKDVPHVILLSGTPLTNKPTDLWPALNILLPRDYPAFFPFASTFTHTYRAPWGWEHKGAKHLDRLHRELNKKCMVRRLKSDVLKDLPAITRTVVPIEIDRREYDKAEADFFGWLEKASPEAATRGRKAEEITRMNGLKMLAGRLKVPGVAAWLRDYFESTDEKFLLGAVHKKVTHALMAEFKNRHPILVDGECDDKQKTAAFDKFNLDPTCELLVGNIQAAGVVWSCRATSKVGLCELPWCPGDCFQFESRVHGVNRGDGTPVESYWFAAPNTIDSDLCQVLETKSGWLDQTLDGAIRDDGLDVHRQVLGLMKQRRGAA